MLMTPSRDTEPKMPTRQDEDQHGNAEKDEQPRHDSAEPHHAHSGRRPMRRDHACRTSATVPPIGSPRVYDQLPRARSDMGQHWLAPQIRSISRAAAESSSRNAGSAIAISPSARSADDLPRTWHMPCSVTTYWVSMRVSVAGP